MGIVPVAPSTKRLWSDGDRKCNGLGVRRAIRGSKTRDSANIPMLTPITTMISNAGSVNSRKTGRRLQRAAGAFRPQNGHWVSRAPMSMRQLGQSIELRSIDTSHPPCGAHDLGRIISDGLGVHHLWGIR